MTNHPLPRSALQSSTVDDDGFLPGEDVAVAVIVQHTTASAAGTALTGIQAHLVGPTCEIILLGRTSGTFVTRELE